MTREEFLKLRERGLLLNERAMLSKNLSIHVPCEGTLWFVEFPDNSWLRCDRINYTTDPLNTARFLTEREAKLIIEYYQLDEFGAFPSEHEFVKPEAK